MGSPNLKLDLIITIIISLCSSMNISMAQDSPKDFLDAHNEARAAVGVTELAWDDKVAAYAEDYAKKMAKDCSKIAHSQGQYGENLVASSGEVSARDAVNMWLAEKKDYDHKTNKCINGKECMHYIQVMWSNTFLLGCAKAKCDNGWTFVICNYDPAGNFDGEQPY